MKAIEPLISGINGAANGTVSIKRRGTGTYATYYTSFEAPTGSAVTPTADVTLDSNGRLVAFVNEFVDVVAKDSSGNTIVTFTAGESAPAIEVVSQSFTGVDYVTAASAASKPTTLQVVLDALKTSTGALDFNVLVGGVSKTLQAAIAGVSGIFYNVKDAAYGAVGDGVVDDLSAIQAACTAANAAGGGIVFFPTGVYRITGTITVLAKVSLMGVGATDTSGGGFNGASISIDHASQNALNFSQASGTSQVVSGLAIQPKQTNSGVMVQISAGAHVRLESCYLGNSILTGRCVRSNTAGVSKVVAVNCTLEVGGTNGHILMTLGHMSCYGSTFIHPSATFAGGISFDSVGGGVAVGCTFVNSTITAGTFTNIRFQNPGTTAALIAGCNFQNPAGGTCTAWDDSTTADSLREVGNTYGSAVDMVPFSVTAAAANRNGYSFHSRATRRSYIQTNATPTTIVPERYGIVNVERTTNTDQTLNINGATTPGQQFVLVYDNGSGGNIGTVTISGAVNTATFPLLAGQVQVVVFVAIEYNAKVRWQVMTGLSASFAR